MMKSQGLATDLNNCDREPIHIPGKIQPQGALLAFDHASLSVLYASENSPEFLGQNPSDLLGQTIFTALQLGDTDPLRELLRAQSFEKLNPMKWRSLNLIAHRSGECIILEFEKRVQSEEAGFSQVYRLINGAIQTIGQSSDISDLCQRTVQEVKNLSGYQRVMIYQFDPAWNGKVIAEAKAPTQDTFLDLHYPASDIPAQARTLYEMNWIRVIPDATYSPVPVLAHESAPPLDLSFSILRSVSPIHLQYLRNMGVTASMSISIIRDQKLWGLIACHHDQPAQIHYEVRQGLEFIGKFFSLQLGALEKFENRELKSALAEKIAKLTQFMKTRTDFLEGLWRYEPNLQSLFEGITGSAILFRGQWTRTGNAPELDQLQALADWIHSKMLDRSVFSTHSIAQDFSEAVTYRKKASGLLCLSIPEPQPAYVIWFKPEVTQTVNWSGNPQKPVEHSGDLTTLSPRRSFAAWAQQVELRSLPWQPEEIQAAEELRRAIIEVDLERQVTLARVSNEELDEFTHVVAHDLKDPLRGIGTYARFIAQDAGDTLDPESRKNLQGILDLSALGRKMISELYEYSTIGKVALAHQEADLLTLVREAKARFQGDIDTGAAVITIDESLPRVVCDPRRLVEVFANLISNAIKYRQESPAKIEISFVSENGTPVFSVRDEGIGIAPENHQRIFKLFERLHEPGVRGEGTGSGLAICKKIIERHGGAMWVESIPGQGATFSFTLGTDRSAFSNDP